MELYFWKTTKDAKIEILRPWPWWPARKTTEMEVFIGNFPRHGDQPSSSPPLAVNPITIISITYRSENRDGSGQKYKPIKIDDLRFGGFLKWGIPTRDHSFRS